MYTAYIPPQSISGTAVLNTSCKQQLKAPIYQVHLLNPRHYCLNIMPLINQSVGALSPRQNNQSINQSVSFILVAHQRCCQEGRVSLSASWLATLDCNLWEKWAYWLLSDTSCLLGWVESCSKAWWEDGLPTRSRVSGMLAGGFMNKQHVQKQSNEILKTATWQLTSLPAANQVLLHSGGSESHSCSSALAATFMQQTGLTSQEENNIDRYIDYWNIGLLIRCSNFRY